MDKLKIKYNYLLARIRKGELYVSTTDFIRSEPKEQNKVLMFLEKLNKELEEVKQLIEIKYNHEMSKLEIEDGFKD